MQDSQNPTPSVWKKRKGELLDLNCPSRGVLDHVTSRWAVLILIVLQEGTHRFSELRREIGGVSEKMLAQTLQVLESDGFLQRTVYPTIPPKVEYSLTVLGKEVADRVEMLTDWIEANLPRVMSARQKKRLSTTAANQ